MARHVRSDKPGPDLGGRGATNMINFIYPLVIHNTDVLMKKTKMVRFETKSTMDEEKRNNIINGLVDGTTLPPFPNNSDEEREFFRWLGGLISTDGSACLRWSGNGYVLDLTMSTVEKDWADMVVSKANGVGLKCSTSKNNLKPRKSMENLSPYVYIIRFETRKTAFYLNYYARDWIMSRKLGKLDEYLSRPLISRLYSEFIKSSGNIKMSLTEEDKIERKRKSWRKGSREYYYKNK
jgi:hypothetical protein